MKVKFKKLSDKAVIPSYAKPGDAGMDLTATRIYSAGGNPVDYDNLCADDDLSMFVYHTDLAVEIPTGFVGLIFPRSSITKQPIMLANSVGVIDSGYRGEIQVRMKFDAPALGAMILDSFSERAGVLPAGIIRGLPKVGDRVAQLVIIPYPTIEPEEVEELSATERGEGGFGSSNILPEATLHVQKGCKMEGSKLNSFQSA